VQITDNKTGLRLLAPDPYTIFQISPLTPLATQRLRLTVAAPAGTQTVTYKLDNQVIGHADAPPWVVWWPLALGEHDLVAAGISSDGKQEISSPIHFTVTNYAPP
jgi:hypothetical protein